MGRLRVASADEISPGDMTAVEASGREILVARIGDEYFAVDNLCSHAEGYLDMGYLLPASCEVGCPLHEGRFDLRTGKATSEPATDPITSYRVDVTGGEVYIELAD